MKKDNLFALSVFWFAWEVHWAALLGAAIQGQVARFEPAGFIGTATAILTGSGAAFSILAQYGAGRLSDKIGRRMPFIVIGTLLDIVALFGFALSPSFLIVVLAFAGVQISLNIAGGPYQAIIPDKIEKSARGRASAYLGLFRLAGNAVGLLLAKTFVHQPGPHVSSAMFTGGLLELATIISVILLVTLAITVAFVSDKQLPIVDDSATKSAWPDRSSFGWLIASRAAVSMGLYLILPYFAFYLEFAQHVADYLRKSLMLLLIMTACSLAGSVPAGILGDRVAKKSIIYAALALLAIGAASLSFIATPSALLPLAIALGIGWGAYYSVDWALACMLLPPGRAGALMAIWNIGASGPQVAVLLLGGTLVDRAGAVAHDLGFGYRLLFGLVAVFVTLGAVALGFVREPRAGLEQRTG